MPPKLTILIEPETLYKLKVEVAKRHTTISDVVRKAIDDFIAGKDIQESHQQMTRQHKRRRR